MSLPAGKMTILMSLFLFKMVILTTILKSLFLFRNAGLECIHLTAAQRVTLS